MDYCTHSVEVLPVLLPEEKYGFLQEDEDDITAVNIKENKLTAFFQLNQEDKDARQYLYEEIPYHYTFNAEKKKWNKRKIATKVVSRLTPVSLNKRPEAYCLRILLRHTRGPRNYEDLRTWEETEYDTYQQCAEARGLVFNNQQWKVTMEEIIEV